MLKLQLPQKEIAGVSLNNHMLLAAGILGTTAASLNRMLENGAGGVVTKSIGPVPIPGHHGPALLPVDGGLMNAMGLPNPSENFPEEIAPLAGKPVVVSIFGGTPEESQRRLLRRHFPCVRGYLRWKPQYRFHRE